MSRRQFLIVVLFVSGCREHKPSTSVDPLPKDNATTETVRSTFDEEVKAVLSDFPLRSGMRMSDAIAIMHQGNRKYSFYLADPNLDIEDENFAAFVKIDRGEKKDGTFGWVQGSCDHGKLTTVTFRIGYPDSLLDGFDF